MEYQICKTHWSMFRGLMFSKKKNLIFVLDQERIIGLHMIFVFFPIDVLFLDKNKRIIEIKKNLKPFSFYISKNKAKYVAEIAKNKRKNYRLGEKIDFT
ncbi:DUF192 domain-containing protein [Candidatus Woesearchaeota archaeon]|nr:DUF192 domain-containing protein [Candidatus Woesearchaeota archaeon]